MRLTIFLTLLALLAVGASAFAVSDDVRINQLRVPDTVYPGEYFPVYVNYEAREGAHVDNLKVRAFVMDPVYGLDYASDGRIDLRDRQASRFDLQAPAYGSQYGAHYALVRVVVSGDGVKRVKHRWVRVY